MSIFSAATVPYSLPKMKEIMTNGDYRIQGTFSKVYLDKKSAFKAYNLHLEIKKDLDPEHKFCHDFHDFYISSGKFVERKYWRAKDPLSKVYEQLPHDDFRKLMDDKVVYVLLYENTGIEIKRNLNTVINHCSFSDFMIAMSPVIEGLRSMFFQKYVHDDMKFANITINLETTPYKTRIVDFDRLENQHQSLKDINRFLVEFFDTILPAFSKHYPESNLQKRTRELFDVLKFIRQIREYKLASITASTHVKAVNDFVEAWKQICET